jgi:hypothetical protein
VTAWGLILPAPNMDDFRRWLRRDALVPGKNGMIPPVPIEAQEGAMLALSGFFALQMGWYAAVKARQVGMTTLLLLWSLWMVTTRPGFVIIWVSPHDKISAEVLAKFRAISTACGVKLARDNAEHAEVDGGGRIVWATIGGSESTADVVGRAGTFHAAILTEIGYPYEPELVDVALDALEPALKKFRAPVFLDSTPNGRVGPGRPYFELVARIQSGEVDGAVFLCPWWLDPANIEDAHEGFARTPEEERLSEVAGGLTNNQLQWRRSGRRTERARRKFAEKYPENLVDCWLDKDDKGVLSVEMIDRMAHFRFPKPMMLPLGKLHDGDPCAAWSGRSWLRVYSAPVSGVKYYAGLDCASGRARDAQALVVVDGAGDVVAVARCYLEGQRLASLVCRVCAWYGAEMLAESQWSAHVVPYLRGGARLTIPGLPQTELDILSHVQRWRFSVEATSERSRTEIMGAALDLAESVGVQDECLWGEMRGLRRDDKGKIKAGPGFFDDVVFAYGLAATLRMRRLARSGGSTTRRERLRRKGEGRIRARR